MAVKASMEDYLGSCPSKAWPHGVFFGGAQPGTHSPRPHTAKRLRSGDRGSLRKEPPLDLRSLHVRKSEGLFWNRLQYPYTTNGTAIYADQARPPWHHPNWSAVLWQSQTRRVWGSRSMLIHAHPAIEACPCTRLRPSLSQRERWTTRPQLKVRSSEYADVCSMSEYFMDTHQSKDVHEVFISQPPHGAMARWGSMSSESSAAWHRQLFASCRFQRHNRTGPLLQL